MRALVVQTFPGANDAVSRHYPYWQKAGFDRVIGLVTNDGLCTWPTSDTVVAGPSKYAEGDHLPRRLLQSLEAGLSTGADEVAVIEYDVVLFRELPSVDGREGIATVPTGGTPPGYSCKRFFHVPWLMGAETARKVIDAGNQMIADGDIEHGMPDCFVGRLIDVTGIPVLEHVFTRYTQNTILPEHYADARAAYRAGVHAMHGIKTKATLDFIIS